MIIENLDSLKVWLVKKLEPICDADPSALAKYVIALAKKDKPEPDLRALCEDQLDVFLGDETKLFVTELFDILQTKAYAPVKPEETNAATLSDQKGIKRKSFDESEKSEVEKVQKTENKPDVGKISENDKENSKENKFKSKPNTDPEKKTNSTESSVQDTEKSNKAIERVKSASRLDVAEGKNDDVNMRSASQDRSVKSMSPALRSRHGHSSRKKSPRSPSRSSGRHSRSSRRDRTRREHRDSSRERRQRRRKKEKCRDYEEKGFCMLGEVCPYDHGYDPVEVDDRNLPQMLSLAGIPSTQANPSQLPAPALQLLPPNVIPARAMMPAMNNGLTLNPGLTTVHLQRPRPIPSPVELPPGSQVPIFRPRNPVAFMRNISPPVTPAATQLAQCSSKDTTTKTSATPGEPYNPEEPSIESEEADVEKSEQSMDTKATIATSVINQESESTNPNMEQDSRSQDELVRIAMGNVPLTPIVGSQPSNVFQLGNGLMQPSQQQSVMPPSSFVNTYQPNLLQHTYLPMALGQQQQYIQLQQQQQQQQQQAAIMATPNMQQQQNVVQVQSFSRPIHRKNTVLEIRKIPRELNNLVKLSEHFQKFGTITKLQAPFDQDPQGALIEFSIYQEATAAYTSPDAILGNRFIKMFWHNPNRNQKNTQGTSGSNTTTNTNISPSDASRQTEQAEVKPKKIASSEELRYVNPKSDPKLIQIEKKKELDKLKIELMKKKQTHYDELVKKQKGILAKLQDKNLSKDEKARLLKAFKHCDTAVQKLKKELMEDAAPKAQPQQQNTSTPLKQNRDYKKEILDKEIDIYHGNLSGEELLEAKKALEHLKREQMTQAGAGRGRGYRGRGRGSWYRGRGRGRGAFHTSTVDNRPKQILVTGYDVSEKDDVVTHFAGFGCLDRIEEAAGDKMILSFPTRKAAEIAAIQGTEFNGKQLILAWFTGQLKTAHSAEGQKIQRRMTRSLSQSLMEKDLDDELLELDKDEEEMLLAGVDDDDDDDMESDERSWRR